MQLDCKELKSRVRQAMHIAHPNFWVITLVYLILTEGVSWLVQLIPDSGAGSVSTLFLSILLGLYTAVLDFGFLLWCLWTYRHWSPDFDALIQGFSVSGRVIWLRILVAIRMMGWIFLISGIISFLLISVIQDLLVVLLIVLPITYFVLYVISLRYALADYLLADFPEYGSFIAIRRSVQLMQGYKMELFKLHLSFLGWGLLQMLLQLIATGVGILLVLPDLSTVLTMSQTEWIQYLFQSTGHWGIAATTLLLTLPVKLWLLPYRGIAVAGFYDARLALAAQQGTSDPLGQITPNQ